ncbi:MAG TPA: chemotaxis protein CheW [Archangium sp.]
MGSVSPSSTTTVGTEQVLTFVLNEQEFGVDILRVQEIRGWSAPMPIPQAPGYVKGVINLRGDIVPIADLRERLGFAHADYGPSTVVVVLRTQSAGQERVLGVIVDAMSDVMTLATSDIRPTPELIGGEEARHTKGIATVGDKLITLLNVDALFGAIGGSASLS